MNIEQELQNLIIQYDIARYTPSYYKYVQAIRIIDSVWKELKLREQPIYFMAEKRYDIEFLLADLEETVEENYKLVFDDNQLFDEKIDIAESAIVFLVSYEKNTKIMTYLRRHYSEDNLVNLYDIFEEKELFFSTDYYDVFAEGKQTDIDHLDLSRIFFYHRCQYEQINEKKLKNRYLEKMIFDTLYAKDFLTAVSLINTYIDVNQDNKRANEYQKFYGELTSFLESIKQCMTARSKKDVYMFWLDCIDYEEIEGVDFLRDEKEKSICFDRAYTVTSNTSPTYRTLFCKMREISDKGYKYRKISKDDSKLIKELEKRGYTFEVIGEHMPTFPTDILHNYYCCFSMSCWDVIKKTVKAKNKCFFLMHELPHTHPGCGSFNNTGFYNYQDNDDLTFWNKFRYIYQQRRRESLAYISGQCYYWKTFWSDEAYKIYMSDHGGTWLNSYHPFMMIEQKDIVPYHEHRIFSYYNFDEMLLSLIDQGEISDSVYQGYARFEDLPRYSKTEITRVLNERPCKIGMTMLGVQGIVTTEGCYFVYGNGQEIYLRKDNRREPFNERDIDELRKQFKLVKLNLEDERFIYTKHLIARYEQLKQQNLEKSKKIKNIMHNWISTLCRDEIIAIRGGGEHTVVMLMQFPELRDKVTYIVDLNKHAVAGKMGYEVLTPDEAKDISIHKIILSSYDLRNIWHQEAVDMGIKDIVDIYQMFENEGVKCNTDYYNVCSE